jgi:hypothetical protein
METNPYGEKLKPFCWCYLSIRISGSWFLGFLDRLKGLVLWVVVRLVQKNFNLSPGKPLSMNKVKILSNNSYLGYWHSRPTPGQQTTQFSRKAKRHSPTMISLPHRRLSHRILKPHPQPDLSHVLLHDHDFFRDNEFPVLSVLFCSFCYICLSGL